MADEKLTAATRLEKILDNIAGGENEITPATRLEKFLSYIADSMEGGGGSGGGAVPVPGISDAGKTLRVNSAGSLEYVDDPIIVEILPIPENDYQYFPGTPPIDFAAYINEDPESFYGKNFLLCVNRVDEGVENKVLFHYDLFTRYVNGNDITYSLTERYSQTDRPFNVAQNAGPYTGKLVLIRRGLV